MKSKYFLSVIFSLLMVGCANSGTALRLGENSFSATDPEKVAILIEAPTRPHVVIGLVDSQASTDDYLSRSRTQAAAVRILKQQAASIGADAVVLTAKGSRPYGELTLTSTSSSAFGTGSATGTASVLGNSIHASGTSSADVSAYTTTTKQTIGWELIQFAGTAVRYTD